MKRVNAAWVSDADGMIVNIENETATEPLISDCIIKILEKGETVGKENIDTSKYPFPTIITLSKFEKGTLEFLESL